jgi:hypothetical protein
MLERFDGEEDGNNFHSQVSYTTKELEGWSMLTSLAENQEKEGDYYDRTRMREVAAWYITLYVCVRRDYRRGRGEKGRRTSQ